jgi:hypothetical protein
LTTRGPNEGDTIRILAKHREASISCIDHERTIHLLGKDCHIGEECNVVLEAVADYDLLICHFFRGMAGSHNYINVLQCSPCLRCHASECNYGSMAASTQKCTT